MVRAARGSRNFPGAAAETTVGEGLADWYAQHYQIARPLVVRNCRITGRIKGTNGCALMRVWAKGAARGVVRLVLSPAGDRDSD